MYGRSAVYVCAAEYITTKKYIAKFYVCESKRPPTDLTLIQVQGGGGYGGGGGGGHGGGGGGGYGK